MKFATKILLALFILLAVGTPITALGQAIIGTASVTATGAFSLSTDQTLTLSAQVIGCSGQLPIYNGTPISVTPNQTPDNPFTANSLQVVTFTLPGNDAIICGGQNYSMYAVTWKINGYPAGPTATYRFVDGQSFDLTQTTPISFVPPVIAPGAGVLCPSGTILNGFTSSYLPVCVVPTGGIGPGNITVSGNLIVTGTTTLSANPTLPLQGATKQYVDSSVTTAQAAFNLSAFIPGTAATSIAAIANQNIGQNMNALFSDNTQSYCAGPAYCSLGTFIDDLALAAMHNPKAFPAGNLLNLVNKFIAAKNANGEFPIALGTSLTPTYYSAWDLHHAYATGDGWIMVPQLLYLYCQDVGLTSSACTSAYTTNVAAIKVALARPPRNGTTGLITVNLGDEYIAGMAFMEYMRNSGDVANANVWYAIICQKFATLAVAAGDTTNATFFNTQYSNTVAAIKANLIDSTTGMLKAATGQNSTNLDVVSSVLADYYGLLTTAQNTAIETYINTNYATLVNSAGFIKETPSGWSVVGYIPVGGGAPYTASSFSSTQYQGGYWSFHFAEFAATLAKANTTIGAPGKVATLLTSYLTGLDPNTEWYNTGSTTPQGTTPNLESPQGALWVAQNYPQIVSSAATTVSVPTQVTYQGSSNNLLSNWSSSSTANTGNYYTNTSGSGYQVADLIEGSLGGNPGVRCELIITNAGATYNLLPWCVGAASTSIGYVRLGQNTYLQWTNTNGADTTGVGVQLTRVVGAATLSIDDGVTPGDAKGNLQDAVTITNEVAFKGTTFTISGATTPVGGSTAGTYVCTGAGTCTAVITVGSGTPSPSHGWLTLEVRDDSTPAAVCSSTARTLTTVTLTCTSVAASDVVEFALAAY